MCGGQDLSNWGGGVQICVNRGGGPHFWGIFHCKIRLSFFLPKIIIIDSGYELHSYILGETSSKIESDPYAYTIRNI